MKLYVFYIRNLLIKQGRPLASHRSFGGVKIGLEGHKLCRGVTGPVPKYFLNNNSFTWAHTYWSKLPYIEPQGPVYL